MKCGLLGQKLTHSYSPQIHNVLGDYPYSLFEVEPQDLKDFLIHGDFTGINVTIPYKKSVIPIVLLCLKPRKNSVRSTPLCAGRTVHSWVTTQTILVFSLCLKKAVCLWQKKRFLFLAAVVLQPLLQRFYRKQAPLLLSFPAAVVTIIQTFIFTKMRL